MITSGSTGLISTAIRVGEGPQGGHRQAHRQGQGDVCAPAARERVAGARGGGPEALPHARSTTRRRRVSAYSSPRNYLTVKIHVGRPKPQLRPKFAGFRVGRQVPRPWGSGYGENRLRPLPAPEKTGYFSEIPLRPAEPFGRLRTRPDGSAGARPAMYPARPRIPTVAVPLAAAYPDPSRYPNPPNPPFLPTRTRCDSPPVRPSTPPCTRIRIGPGTRTWTWG